MKSVGYKLLLLNSGPGLVEIKPFIRFVSIIRITHTFFHLMSSGAIQPRTNNHSGRVYLYRISHVTILRNASQPNIAQYFDYNYCDMYMLMFVCVCTYMLCACYWTFYRSIVTGKNECSHGACSRGRRRRQPIIMGIWWRRFRNVNNCEQWRSLSVTPCCIIPYCIYDMVYSRMCSSSVYVFMYNMVQ